MEKYSVLMALYAKENPEYLTQAIESMVAQTIFPDEIVIVKDGEIPQELTAILETYVQKYPNLFNVVGYEENRGLGYALNFGLKVCKNELVARMDTDDIAKPNRIEKQLLEFEDDSALTLSGTFVEEFEESTDKIISIRKVPTTHEEIYKFNKRRSAFNHPTVMYKKTQVLEIGGYSELRRNQDVELFGRMLFAGYKASNIAEALVFFRCNNALKKRRKSWKNTKSYIATIKKFWKMGYSSFGDYFKVAVAQTLVFLCPAKLQQWIYKKFLRG